MLKPLKGFGSWVVSCLLLLSVALSACSGYVDSTPTSPVSLATPAAQAQDNNASVPVIKVNNPSSSNQAAAPIKMAAAPATGTKAAVATPVETISQDEAVSGLGANSGFYEFPYADSEFYIHMPPAPKPGRSLQIVMAIHGMGGNGVDFGKPLLDYADEYGFVLVAPTMNYDPDYTDPAKVAANDELLLPELNSLIQALPGVIGYPVNSQVMLFGFSRGAQIVHRFALFYPEVVKGVALMSAGSYTLPYQDFKTSDNAKTALRFPYGVSDLAKFTGHNFDLQAFRKVPFWIGVGGADNATKDVPQAWNLYLGETRVERATRFYQALQKSGINATFNVFPGIGHAVCAEMKQDGFAFFNKLLG